MSKPAESLELPVPFAIDSNPGNIIDLTEEGLLPQTAEVLEASEEFLPNHSSPLNEW